MVFDVTLVNEVPELRAHNSLAFEAFDADGYKYTAFGAMSKQALRSGTVSPDQKVRGFVAYEVPSGQPSNGLSGHRISSGGHRRPGGRDRVGDLHRQHSGRQ
jgi:hypothetical protein